MIVSHRDCRAVGHQDLNEHQHLAVHSTEGPFVMAACAGAGKTKVVINRMEQLMRQGVDPKKIGAFTFSREAANEMKNRGQLLSFPTDLQTATLHSLCYEILRDDGAQWVGAEPRVDQTALYYAMKDLISRDFRDRDLDPNVASALIGLAKANCLTYHPIVGDEYHDQIVELFKKSADRGWLAPHYAMLFQEMDRLRYQRGLMDFDDMLILSWLALTRDNAVRNKWNQRFNYLLVDEAQDSSRVQNAVVDILAEKHENIMRIGDAAQSLYRWRGAQPEEFIAYSNNCTLITLPINYRSTKQICTYATNLTAGASWNVTGPTLPHAGAPDDPKSALAVEFENPEDEAKAVVEDIQNRIADGVNPGKFAVLYRVTYLAYPIENALMKAGIPYVVWSGMNFFERKEIKDLLAYLRVATLRDPDETHVKRTIHAPFRYIGKAYVNEVEDYARSNGLSFVDGLNKYISSKDSQTRNGRKLYELFLALNGMIGRNATAAQALDYVVRETRYLSYLKKDEGEEGPDPEGGRLAHVHQLFRIAQAFKTTTDLLEYVDKTSAALNEARGKKDVDAVVLASIHRFKGLEREHVYGIGWNEGVLPHVKNPDQGEEQRLAYVCLTRAQKTFQASWCRSMVTPNGSFQGAPSQYIARSRMPVQYLATHPQRNVAMAVNYNRSYGKQK